jgi:peptide/nickel transport system substrate-binding protein
MEMTNANADRTLDRPISRRTLLTGTAGLFALGKSKLALAAGEPVRGGTLTMAVWPDPTALVGAFTSSDQITIVSGKVTEGLLTYGYDFAPQPRLATTWEVAADGLSIRFDLRKGVKWHDGEDFTSDDVGYSIFNLLRPNHPRGRVGFANVTEVETPDPYTAIIRLSKPSPMIMNALAGYESPILPKHIYENGDPLRNPANAAPIGTGPFRFVEWNRGSDIIFERNPTYWDLGKPYLDRIVIRILNDAGARSAALEAGEILLAGPNPVPYSELARFRAKPDFTVETRGEELLTHGQAMQINLRNPDLAKLDVRRAIYQAINREQMARIVWYGSGRPAISLIPYQAGDLRPPDLPLYPYDPKAAEELLDKAGLPRTGPNRMRMKLRIDSIPLGEANQLAAEFVKNALQRVGIDATIRASDLPTYLKLVYTDYDFDLNIFLFTPTHDPSLGVQRFYWSKAAQRGSPFVNAGDYANPEVDKILEAAASEPDPAKRKQEFWDFQRIVMTDLPVLPLIDLDYTMIFNNRVHDVVASPEGLRGNFADVWISG